MANLSPFEEQLTAERSPLFTLTSVTPLSPIRNILTGTPTHSGTEYLIEADEAIETTDIGRYVPGFGAEAGIGVRVGTDPTGDQVMRWGYYDDEDGFFFEYDTSGLYAVTRRDSTDTRVAQADWNVDPMDGSTPGGFVIELDRGNIFQIPFTWYGYGQVNFAVAQTTFTAAQDVVVGHRFRPDSNTSIRNPNLPIKAEVTGSGDGQLYVSGRQFAIVGRYIPQQRTNGLRRTLSSIGTSWTPIIAVRRQDNDSAKRTEINVQGVTAFTDGKVEIAVVVNPTITFGTAQVPDLATTSETVVEFSDNPSSFSLGAGNTILTDILNASGSGSNATGNQTWPGISIPIPRRQPAVLVARAFTGTVTVDAHLQVIEEW